LRLFEKKAKTDTCFILILVFYFIYFIFIFNYYFYKFNLYQKTGTKDSCLILKYLYIKTGTDNSLILKDLETKNWQFTYYQNPKP